MSSARSVDDILSGYTQTEPDIKIEEPTETEAVSGEAPEVSNKAEESGQEESASEIKSEAKTVESESNDDDTDEYGNTVKKSRMYSEEEVQRMIRDRISRGRHAEIQPHQQAQVQQAAQNFQGDPNNSDSWEVQLEGFVKNTIDKISKETQTKSWQKEETERQANFEAKFTSGMEKYKDFREVAQHMPITDSMMLATREMKDPAAFIYAACKTHPEEVKRIASLTDPYHQASEIGRLEERMKKAVNMTKAAKPLSPTKSDFSNEKIVPKRSIDDLINKHAKSKLRR